MVSLNSTNWESRQAIFVGPVQVISYQNDHISSYLEAFCSNNKSQSARLRLIKTTFSNEKAIVKEILFTNVKKVNYADDHIRKCVVLMFEDDSSVKFYADSEQDTMRWFRYCGLLSTLPFCTIPTVPQQNFVTQRSIDEYTDPQQFNATCLWVVYILNEGIAKDNVDLNRLCVITIRSSDSTFNIHDFNTGKHLLSWDHAEIIQGGGVESLVFLEAGTKCSGGSRFLWMHHPLHQAMTLRRCLQQFICFGPENISQPKPPSFSVPTHDLTASKAPLLSSSSYKSFQLNKYVNRHKRLPTSYPKTRQSKTPHSYNFVTFRQQNIAQYYKPVSSQSSVISLCSSGYASDANSLSCDTLSRNFHSSICSALTSDSCATYGSLDCKADSCTNIHTVTSFERIPNNVLTKSHPLSFQSQGYESTSIHDSSPNYQLVPIAFQSEEMKRTLSPEDQYLDSCCLGGHQQYDYNTSDALPSTVSYPQNLSHNLHSSAEQMPVAMGGTKRLSVPEARISSSPEVSAFQKCTATILEKLNLPAILPYLVAQNMVTQSDIEIMTNSLVTDKNKTLHLISTLPSKGDGFLWKFVLCLCQSKLGTNHDDIVKSLTASLNEVKRSTGFLRLGKNRTL